MIDLHLHTRASDGLLSPADLVRRVAAVGITVMSVTDHDTVAGLSEARDNVGAAGIQLVDGIEITAVHDEQDVHILGYFIEPDSIELGCFLEAQRARRVERVREIGARLAQLGATVDVAALIATAASRPGTSVGRPMIARALVAAGRVSSIQEAFDRYLASGQPAFVPRVGPTPLDVVEKIHSARGIASMAHPGVTRQPSVMDELVNAGLDAIEVHHSDHAPSVRDKLRLYAAQHRLLVTGGSDFHGDDDRGRQLGGVTLPASEFVRLETAARDRRTVQ